jgi:hypothetical protein
MSIVKPGGDGDVNLVGWVLSIKSRGLAFDPESIFDEF